ncbi:MAG: hypothetical protein ACOY4K_00105 [Pseudomonadota bacterium]
MKHLLLAILVSAAAPAIAKDAPVWRVVGQPGDAVFALTVPIGDLTWTFQCEAETVALMQTGVTELMDVQTGQKIPDEPGSKMTPGAAVMGLLTDKANSGMLPALARPNAVRGWDMLVRLPKNDSALRGMGKAKMIVVMTTGFTAAVNTSAEDRVVIADFLKRCLNG